MYYPRLKIDGPLAQLVEQWTFNPFVVGSNPTRPTIFPQHSLCYRILVKQNVKHPLPDQVLDARGLNCPLPILKTKLALQRMGNGQILQVMATDPHSVVDFKAYCARTGHELIELIETDQVMEFYIRRHDDKK